MKNLIITLFSFTIFFISCGKTQEEDFFQKKYDTDDVEIITLLETDSAYSPHVTIDKIYKTTHQQLTQENHDSLFEEFLYVRRTFMNPPYNNCIKKTYAIKINGGGPYIHSLYYVPHRGKTCVHDKETIIRQLSDIEHTFYHFKHAKEKNQKTLHKIQDSCLTL